MTEEQIARKIMASTSRAGERIIARIGDDPGDDHRKSVIWFLSLKEMEALRDQIRESDDPCLVALWAQLTEDVEDMRRLETAI